MSERILKAGAMVRITVYRREGPEAEATPEEAVETALSRIRGVGDGEIDFAIMSSFWLSEGLDDA